MKQINWVCYDCGTKASRLTYIKKYGKEPEKLCFDVSCYHEDICDVCGKVKAVTSVRDYFYPDFSLLESPRVALKSKAKGIKPIKEKPSWTTTTNAPEEYTIAETPNFDEPVFVPSCWQEPKNKLIDSLKELLAKIPNLKLKDRPKEISRRMNGNLSQAKRDIKSLLNFLEENRLEEIMKVLKDYEEN